MTPSDVLDIGQSAIYVMLQVSGPVMLIALAVGLLIALFQALTQIQEMSLTFVPKIIAIFASLGLLFPYMGSKLSGLMIYLTDYISTPL